MSADAIYWKDIDEGFAPFCADDNAIVFVTTVVRGLLVAPASADRIMVPDADLRIGQFCEWHSQARLQLLASSAKGDAQRCCPEGPCFRPVALDERRALTMTDHQGCGWN